MKNWLSRRLHIDSSSIDMYFKNNNVTGFLMIWTIFEQGLFSGYIRFDELKKFSVKNQCFIASETILDDNFTYFHNRYQNKEFYKNLVHNENKQEIEEIRNAEIEKINNEDKLKFLLYIVYRYRNNIFHGNKGVLSWMKYEEQIDKCVLIMTKLIDLKKI